jgi:hypothetical protein
METSVAVIQEDVLGLKVSINEPVLWLKQQGANQPWKAQGMRKPAWESSRDHRVFRQW